MDVATQVLFDVYLTTFAATQDAYVYDSGVHRASRLTPDIVHDAFVGGHAVSAYTARRTPDGRMLTHVGAIDFDGGTVDDAIKVREALTLHGIDSLLALSRRSAHLWVTPDHGDGSHGSERFGQVPAAVVRKALTNVVSQTLPSLWHEKKIEVFPKRSDSSWGVGALRLPLMTHPKSKKRYPCYDMAGNRLTRLVEVATVPFHSPWHNFVMLSESSVVEYPRGLGTYRVPPKHEDGSAVALLQRVGVEAVAGRVCRCPLHDDKRASLSVAADDQRVWCKSPSCEAYNDGLGLGTHQLEAALKP